MIKNTKGLSAIEVTNEIQQKAKFVVFEYCISIIFLTFRRSSSVYLIKSNESALKYGWPFIVISLLFGWWGFPWGPIYTATALKTTMSGGKDVTQQIIAGRQ